MAIELTWLGHATWQIKSGNHEILLDPFLTDSPSAPVKADSVNPGWILVSHGHFDHVADVETVAKSSGAKVITSYEIAEWFGRKGVENTIGMNIGGKTVEEFGTVKMTQAFHSSSLPDGSYGGQPAGFLLTIEGKNIYFACDTGLFSDMSLIGKVGIDAAIVPIGDLFTMGVDDSIDAVKLLNPKQTLPTHYNTWPPIEQDASQWAELVKSQTSSQPIVLQPGQTHEL